MTKDRAKITAEKIDIGYRVDIVMGSECLGISFTDDVDLDTIEDALIDHALRYAFGFTKWDITKAIIDVKSG